MSCKVDSDWNLRPVCIDCVPFAQSGHLCIPLYITPLSAKGTHSVCGVSPPSVYIYMSHHTVLRDANGLPMRCVRCLTGRGVRISVSTGTDSSADGCVCGGQLHGACIPTQTHPVRDVVYIPVSFVYAKPQYLSGCGTDCCSQPLRCWQFTRVTPWQPRGE